MTSPKPQTEPLDMKLERLIDDSDGIWHEDVFHIDSLALMNLLRNASGLSPAGEADMPAQPLEEFGPGLSFDREYGVYRWDGYAYNLGLDMSQAVMHALDRALGGSRALEAPSPSDATAELVKEIIQALQDDEKGDGFDLTSGLFGHAFSALVRRLARVAPPAAQQADTQAEPYIDPEGGLYIAAPKRTIPQAVSKEQALSELGVVEHYWGKPLATLHRFIEQSGAALQHQPHGEHDASYKGENGNQGSEDPQARVGGAQAHGNAAQGATARGQETERVGSKAGAAALKPGEQWASSDLARGAAPQGVAVDEDELFDAWAKNGHLNGCEPSMRRAWHGRAALQAAPAPDALDTARLDFLEAESHKRAVVLDPGMRLGQPGTYGRGKSLRDSIDAARAALAGRAALDEGVIDDITF